MITKETITCEPDKENKKILIKRYMEDLLEPKEFNENFKQVTETLTSLKDRLKGLDAEKDKAKEFIEKQIKELQVRADGLVSADQQSRLWAEEAKLEDERKSNPLVGG